MTTVNIAVRMYIDPRSKLIVHALLALNVLQRVFAQDPPAPPPPNADNTEYSKQDLLFLADEMLTEFNKLPTVDTKKQCANQNPESTFYKYVVNIHKELEKINYADPDGYYIKNGYTFLDPWAAVGGWKCHSHLSCVPPDDVEQRLKDGSVIVYTCRCGITKGVSTSYPSHPIPGSDPVECQYDSPNSICSASQSGIKCAEQNNVCLVDEFDVLCDLENENHLLNYLKQQTLERRPDDCKCRPKSEQQAKWSVDQIWTTESYLLGGKPKSLRGEACANLPALIGELRRKHQEASGTSSYRLPASAQQDFEALKNDQKVTNCDELKELECLFADANQHFGTCGCRPVPKRSGWMADPTNPVTPDGYCALASNSDCILEKNNNFRCQPPEECVIEVCNVACTKKNQDAFVHESCIPGLSWASNKTDGDRPDDERYVKRCHCYNGPKVYKDLGARKEDLDAVEKKKPIFDLGYGSNDCNPVTEASFWTVNFGVVSVVFFSHYLLLIPAHFVDMRMNMDTSFNTFSDKNARKMFFSNFKIWEQ